MYDSQAWEIITVYICVLISPSVASKGPNCAPLRSRDLETVDTETHGVPLC